MDDMREENLTEQALSEAAEILSRYLYDQTAASKVTPHKALLLKPLEGIDKEQMTLLLSGIEGEDVQAALVQIAKVLGKKDTYYYDKTIMTQQYAKIDALLMDKDILETIASVTRNDSRLYPRATPFDKLQGVPFRFSMDELLGAAARMQNEEKYADIGVVEASNGKRAFFSEKHLSRKYARALWEQMEVEDRENP